MSNVAAGKDTDDEGEVLNDVEKTLNSLNIALRSSKGEWRSFEDVLDEVAEKWEKFTGTEKSHIATAIAGTRQQENFRAMMNNWDEVTRLTNVAANSTGSATERMNVYLDSVEAKTNNLKSAWEGFVMSLNQSDSWKQLLDWLTQFLEKLKYVDWKLVGIVATGGGILTLLLKIAPAIKTLISTIKAGGILAGISSGGIIPILGLIATAILTISTAWKSANENAEQQIESIKKQKEALDNEKQSVEELYQQYSELEGKSKYYTLTAEEKQKLVDVSKDLVEKYGLEADGVDSLTGKYEIATDALKKYNEQTERTKRVLDTEEKKALKKDFTDTEKKTNNQNVLYRTQYETDYLNPDVKNSNLGLIYDGKKRILTEKELEKAKDNVEMLGNVLFDEDSWTKDFLGQKTMKKGQSQYYHSTVKSLVSDYGIDLSKVNYNDYSSKEDFIEALNNVVTQQQNELKSSTISLAEKATKYLNSEFTNEVSSSISNMMEDSIKEHINNGGGIGGDFLDNYKKKFVVLVNANGENYSKIVDNYKRLQEKADSGELTANDYKEYQDNLRTYIELQKEAAKATGMTDKQVNKYINNLATKAFSNLNTKMLELKENMQQAKDENGNNLFSQEQIKNFDNYTNKIIELNKQFKNGEITTKDYFEKLNKHINSVDPTNLEQIKNTFGDINNYMTTMVSTFQDSANFLNSIWTTFQGGGDSLEFLKGFLPAAQQVQSMTDNFLKIEESVKNIDLDTRNIDYTKDEKSRYDITERDEEIQKRIKTTYDVDIPIEKINEAVKVINELDGKSVDVYIDENSDKVKDGFDDVLQKVDDVTDGTADLQSEVKDLGGALNELADLDFENLDKSFEIVSKAFDELPKGMTSLIGNASEEVKNSAKAMSDWMISVAKSNSAYAETAKQNIINTMSTVKQEVTDATQVSSEALANAYLADAQNSANFAKDANSIAQQAMSEAVKKLGNVLNKMGEAIANLDIEIPLSLDGLKDSVKVAGINIPVEIPNIKTVFKIGGEGTKGLSGIGKALSDFGQTLSSDTVSNTIASNFTPVEANYKPNNIGDKDNGNGGKTNHTPSGGGKNKKSGSEYTPEEAEKDKKSILNDIEDYERDIEADLEDQTEQLVNHYNLERNKLETLREELDYYDAIYDSTENTTKWLETQLDILDEESKKISEMQQSNEKIDAQRKKIYAENKQYNVESWFDSEGNDTLAYGDMLNSFEYKKEAIQKEVAQKMRAEYNRIANSTDKDAIKDAKEKIKLIEEEGDLRIKELEKEKERIENIHDSVETLNDAWDENQEKIRESLQELNDRIKSIRDELIDDLMEQLERATDKMNKSLESNATRLEQLKQVQESYNSLLNDTLYTQDELMDELQANLDSYQYLDEDMRQLMFNEDDYKKLSGVLGDIQEDIAGIWEDHYSQISNLSEDEMYKAQYITAETERQLAAKQKEYDLARAELDIAKAKTNLENVKNERNTRIFANGQWQWVADPTAVRDAQKALADQERAKNKIEREAEQQELIDSLDRLIDSDNLQIDENNDLLEKIQEAIEQETEEVKSIDQALENIKNANLPEINTTLINALGKDGGHMTELLKNINKNQTSLAAALRGQTIEQAEKQLKSGTMDKKAFEELVTRLGYSFNESTGKITTQDGSFDAHYAGWTKKPNNDIQTGTANNGVQVTGGNGGQQQHSPSSTIDSVANKNSQEALKQIAREVWLGKWGNGQDRKNRLTAAGYDYAAVQALVNKGRKYFFDQGGVSTGIGLMPKDTLEPERVLSPRQTKSFDNLVNNLTTNPVLSALSRNPSVVSNLTNMGGTTSSDKNYYFSNFTIQSDDIGQFISSIETMIPMKNN